MSDAITPMTILALGTCAFMAAMYLLTVVAIALWDALRDRKRRKNPMAIGLAPKSEFQEATDTWRASQPLRANEDVYNPSRYDRHIARRLGHVSDELDRRELLGPLDEK
jgi:hypothetical protein